jgi:hypothetical protein
MIHAAPVTEFLRFFKSGPPPHKNGVFEGSIGVMELWINGREDPHNCSAEGQKKQTFPTLQYVKSKDFFSLFTRPPAFHKNLSANYPIPGVNQNQAIPA